MNTEQVKVTLREAPAAQVLAKANEETVTTDARGRVIKLKKPGVLAQYRLIEALGDSAANQTYMGMVLPLIYVTAIDDLAVNPPKLKMHVEALIQQLDEDGIEAVMKHVQETYGKTDPDADKAELKK
ncbi:hypothetical protein [Janthinobacterium sp. GMG1]|uniref:hypothetical protein n=1 Tax=Janthinobacterium sp. GMG1 TaxID=3096007 RepID=UPI000C11203A|nr:hypothetical protein [Janthinobacterium sp. GMG1]MDZ5633935.1 hypothetical protein [Janthinobacterium sp. GMG1]PHV13710.1 hypothetical protein CSQ90_27070 [Janthinobacterium sp. BJB303]